MASAGPTRPTRAGQVTRASAAVALVQQASGGTSSSPPFPLQRRLFALSLSIEGRHRFRRLPARGYVFRDHRSCCRPVACGRNGRGLSRVAAAGGRWTGGAVGRGDALCRAGRRQATFGRSWSWRVRRCSRSPRPAPPGWPPPSRCCTPIRWSTTICRPWTTTICGAASPHTHRAFDEATAILAGDALQARAFEVLAEPDTHADPQARCELVARPGCRIRRARHGGRSDDRHAGGGTQPDRRRDYPPAGAEDRAADPVQRRGRRHPRPCADHAAAYAGCLRTRSRCRLPDRRRPARC